MVTMCSEQSLAFMQAHTSTRSEIRRPYVYFYSSPLPDFTLKTFSIYAGQWVDVGYIDG